MNINMMGSHFMREYVDVEIVDPDTSRIINIGQLLGYTLFENLYRMAAELQDRRNRNEFNEMSPFGELQVIRTTRRTRRVENITEAGAVRLFKCLMEYYATFNHQLRCGTVTIQEYMQADTTTYQLLPSDPFVNNAVMNVIYPMRAEEIDENATPVSFDEVDSAQPPATGRPLAHIIINIVP